MKKNGFSHMRRWLWIFLLLVILSTAITYLLVYQEVAGTLTKQTFQASAISQDHGEDSSTDSLWAALRLRILLVLTAGLLVVGAIGFLWMRMAMHHLNRPVRLIQRAISRLASGKLNETVIIDTPDEYGQIGSGINELAANLQELLLFIWKQTGECDHLLDEILKNNIPSDNHRPNEEDLKKLSEAIQNLREMAKAYVFYDVRLEGEQALAINEPGQPTLHNNS